MKHLFTDGAYDRLKLMDKAIYLDFIVEIICCQRRWVVENTFGWMTRWQRVVRDYECCVDVSQAMIFVAMGANLMRRNAHS
ncbi:transposase [Komagataeibacter oboediens DSM 11826]|nr:transposase [Komagataeibacter oboediens DSM 11826]